jgi:hypothetical protein
MAFRNLDAKSALRVGLKITNHPPAAARKSIIGILRKIAIGLSVMFERKEESRRTANVIEKEARAEKRIGLIDVKMVAEARRDKTAVTAR